MAGYPKILHTEEGMRDGLQIENPDIPVADKIRLIDALSETGLKEIAVGSFVSPKWTPQMACIDGYAAHRNARAGQALYPGSASLCGRAVALERSDYQLPASRFRDRANCSGRQRAGARCRVPAESQSDPALSGASVWVDYLRGKTTPQVRTLKELLTGLKTRMFSPNVIRRNVVESSDCCSFSADVGLARDFRPLDHVPTNRSAARPHENIRTGATPQCTGTRGAANAAMPPPLPRGSTAPSACV